MVFAFLAGLAIVSMKTRTAAPTAPQPLDNAVHSTPPLNGPQPDSAPTWSPAAPHENPAPKNASPQPESAELAGFRPVSSFEPKVVGILK